MGRVTEGRRRWVYGSEMQKESTRREHTIYLIHDLNKGKNWLAIYDYRPRYMLKKIIGSTEVEVITFERDWLKKKIGLSYTGNTEIQGVNSISLLSAKGIPG